MSASASDIRAGRAFVELGTNDVGFQKGLDAARAKFAAFSGALQTIGSALAFKSVTDLLGGWVHSFADAGREMYLLSQRTGASVEELGALKQATSLSGIGFDELGRGISHMQHFLTEVAHSGLDSNDTLGDLGVTLSSLANSTPVDQFATIAQSIAAMGSSAQRTGAAMAIFGREGQMLIPAFRDLPATLERARAGAVASAADIARAFDLSVQFDVLGRSIKGVQIAIGSALAPAFMPALELMSSALGTAKDWVKANQGLVQGFGLVIGTSAALAAGLTGIATAAALAQFTWSGLMTAVGGATRLFGAGAGLVGAMLSPMGLLTAGVVGLGALFLSTSDAAKSAFSRIGDMFGDVWGGIVDAVSSCDLGLAFDVVVAGANLAWDKFNSFLSETIGITLIDVWASLKAGWIETVAFMKTAWVGLTSFLEDAGQNAGTSWFNTFLKAFGEIAGLSKDVIDTTVNQLTAEQQGANAARARDRDNRLAQIEAERIRDRQAATDGANRANGILGNGDAERALQDSLDAAAAARRAHDQALADRMAPGLGAIESAFTAGSRGTFNSSAAFGLVGQSAEVQELKALRAIFDNRLNQLIDGVNRIANQQAVFQ